MPSDGPSPATAHSARTAASGLARRAASACSGRPQRGVDCSRPSSAAIVGPLRRAVAPAAVALPAAADLPRVWDVQEHCQRCASARRVGGSAVNGRLEVSAQRGDACTKHAKKRAREAAARTERRRLDEEVSCNDGGDD